MDNTKLVNLLKHLEVKERKDLQKWVELNAGKRDSFRFLQYLLKYIHHQKTEKLSKEKIHRTLFRTRKYNDLKMRFMSFELLRLCEDFIVYQTNSENSLQYHLSLLQFYRKRNLSKLFEQRFSSIKKELNEMPLRDHEYFLISLQADSEYNRFLKSKQNRTIEPAIQQLSDDLDHFYLLNKIKVYAEALNYKNILKADYNIRFIDTLISEMNQEDTDSNPAIHIHFLALMTLRENEEEKYFYELLRKIKKHRSIFPLEELRDLYTLARNYCIRKINLGNQKFNRELFLLYQQELELINKSAIREISPMTYKNITALAFKIQEHDWAYHFIRDFTNYLPEEHRDSYFNFNMARYYFIREDFDKVISLLSHLEYKDVFIQLSAKALQLKTYFETESFAAFDSLGHSFRVLLKNKKKLGYHRTNYLNFIKYSEKLFSGKALPKKELKKLKTEILQTKELIDKEWLIEKAEQIR